MYSLFSIFLDNTLVCDYVSLGANVLDWVVLMIICLYLLDTFPLSLHFPVSCHVNSFYTIYFTHTRVPRWSSLSNAQYDGTLTSS